MSKIIVLLKKLVGFLFGKTLPFIIPDLFRILEPNLIIIKDEE